MALRKNRLLFHGTLLFDTDLEMLDEVLKSSAVKIESKGVKSVRSRVTNLKEYFHAEMDILQFKQSMKQLLFADTPITTYTPSQVDIESIQELVKTKYETWEWNFGSNPNSRIERSCQLPDGVLEIRLELEKGYIKACQIKSDFKMRVDIGEIEKRLENVRYIFTDVQSALNGLDIDKKLRLISDNDFVKLILC
jgi:lipoate-protein ligase A